MSISHIIVAINDKLYRTMRNKRVAVVFPLLKLQVVNSKFF
jgi:hypothetical protein